MKIVVLFYLCPNNVLQIPVLKIALSHAHKCVISDVIRHMPIFSFVTSFPGASCMSDPGKNYPRTHCSMTSALLTFLVGNKK